MGAPVAELGMGRKKTPDNARRDDVAVKLDRLLVQKAKLVAGRKGITLAEYISEMIRQPVEKEFAKAVKDMGADR